MPKKKYLIPHPPPAKSPTNAPAISLIGKNSSHWTFGKASRFRYLKRSITPDFTTLPSTLGKRTTTFGYGKRWIPQNSKGRDSPSPTTYHPPSCFDLEKKAPSFGLRCHTDRTVETKKAIPGPGSYNPYSPMGHRGPKFTFSPRIEHRMKACTPPPDNYCPNFNLVEKANYSAIGFGIGDRSKSPLSRRESSPGPGTYEIPSGFRSNNSRPGSPGRSVTPLLSRRHSTKAKY
ncbi:unnamed protein product [Blepharisma stoltei]|uniref:Uncharacterized protein n=1 Tax=Blepharisma stoltei TaxID=1481888 RepID=A0AAU9JR43_9CILI|nr:unnamed protein product [Blepharisma stoltei]